MTSNEALQCGLVTRVLWPDRFMEELIPIIKKIAQQSAQVCLFFLMHIVITHP